MKILYGICGEGLGHAIRSGVVRDHLVSRGHEVTFACSKGRALNYLARYGPVAQVPGLYWPSDGKLGPAFFARNGINLSAIELSPLRLMASLPRPDVVVSDFEPCVARYAGMLNLPLISIGNIEFLTHCSHDIDADDRATAALAFPVVKNMVPGAAHYFVTSFADAPIRSAKTSLHMPIIRPELLNMTRHGIGEDSVVVYFNDKSPWPQIVRTLQMLPDVAFSCYGSPVKSATTLGNVKLWPLGDGFMSDLVHSCAVVGGAGFTLAIECVYSGKPLLALPFDNHAEQIFNAVYLERLGFGQRCRELTPECLRSFLERAPSYARNLAGVSHDGNVGLLSAIDRAIAA